MNQQELLSEKNVRVLVTSKISGYFGVDVWIPSDNPASQPFVRLSGTLSIKEETYEKALQKGIEFYEDYIKSI